MNIQELRLGNRVKQGIVYAITTEYVGIVKTHNPGTKLSRVEDCHIEELDPEPITPEWLERYGLIETHEKGKFYILNEIYIELERNFIMLQGWIIGRCEYIHQLQNLYFSLTGQELTLKEPVK